MIQRPAAATSALVEALTLSGLRMTDNGAHFGDIAAELSAALSQTVVMPLQHLSYLRCAGADADAFLQGQLSNDLRELTATRAQLSSYSTPKGRALALFVLMRQADGSVLLETQADVAAETLKRLRLFVMRSKLTLEDAGNSAAALGLAGPEAGSLLAAAGLPVPESAWGCASAGLLSVVRRPGTLPRFSVHGPTAALASCWPIFADSAVPVGTASWRLLEILAGVPSVRAQTREEFVPQMLNLDTLGGISFTKGCYPGQEIVARLHYLGTAKRRMVRGWIDSLDVPAPGTPILLAGGDGQSVGEVVDAAMHPNHGVVLLAVLQTALTDPAALRLGTAESAQALSRIDALA